MSSVCFDFYQIMQAYKVYDDLSLDKKEKNLY